MTIRTVIAAAAAFALAATATPAAAQGGWRSGALVAPVGAGDRVYGPAEAEITLIVWLDPECPYCKQFGQTGEKLVDANNANTTGANTTGANSTGKLNLIVRLMPLPFHGEPAIAASAASLCVAEQAGAAGFYRFLDRYLALTATNGRGIPASAGRGSDAIGSLAQEAGASDMPALRTCRRAPETLRRVMGESAAAEAAGVGGTPSIAIRNNRTGDSLMADGAIPQDAIQSAIDWLAARSAAKSTSGGS